MVYRIDPEDQGVCSGYNWRKNALGYVVAYKKIDGKFRCYYQHRVVMGATKGQIVDHINGDKSDNRRANLRFATRSTNAMNRAEPSNNTSGHRGVYWRAERNRWLAYISVHGKRRSLGNYREIEDAINARLKAEAEHFGEFRLGGG